MLGPGPARHWQLEGYFCTKHVYAVTLCLETKDKAVQRATREGMQEVPPAILCSLNKKIRKAMSRDNKITAVNL